MQVKLLLVIFYLNGRLHAVSIGKLSKQMSNFWRVQFLKTESEPNFGFPHIPSEYHTYFCASSDVSGHFIILSIYVWDKGKGFPLSMV